MTLAKFFIRHKSEEQIPENEFQCNIKRIEYKQISSGETRTLQCTLHKNEQQWPNSDEIINFFPDHLVVISKNEI